jgi:Xaa-Pro aminopeptidase
VDFAARNDLDSLRARRVERAHEAMRAAGLDALLVFKDENVRYLTSLRAQLIAGKTALLNGCLLLPGTARSCSSPAATSAARRSRCRGSRSSIPFRSSRRAA